MAIRAKRWSRLGDVIAELWERAITRVESWCDWRGDFSDSELEAETVWEHIKAEPIELIFADASYFTVRGYLEVDEATFLGSNGEIVVFADVASLAEYCRSAKDHDLVKLEWWSELAEEEDDEIFEPGEGASFDLTTPTPESAEVVRELVAYCNLEGEFEEKVEDVTWTTIVAEIETCLRSDS